MADRFWVGGAGLPDDTAHWSISDGGSGGASLPTSTSDVKITPLSGLESGGTIGDGSSRSITCNNITMTQGGTITISASTTVNVYGDASLRNISNSTNYKLAPKKSGNQNLTSNGAWCGAIEANKSGSLILQDDISGSAYTNLNGTFDLNGRKATFTGAFRPYNSTQLKLSLGWLVCETFSAQSNTTTIDAVGGTIECTFRKALDVSLTFVGGWHFGTLFLNCVSPGTPQIKTYTAGGTLTIDKLQVASSSLINHQPGITLAVGAFEQTGTPSATTTLKGYSASTWNITCAQTVSLIKASIQWSAASGGGLFLVDHASSTIDANSTGWGYGVAPTVSEAVAIGEGIDTTYTPAGGGQTYNEAVSEGVTVAESASAAGTATQGVSESATVAESATGSATANQGVSESATIAESLVATATGTVTVSEALAAVESLTAAGQSVVSAAESLGLSESVSAGLVFAALLAETLSEGGSVSAVVQAVQGLSESTVLDEYVNSGGAQTYTVTVGEGFTFDESAVASLRHLVGLSDSAAISEALASAAQFSQGLAESHGLSESLAAQMSAAIAAAESVATSEEVGASRRMAEVLTEALEVLEDQAAQQAASVAVNESTTITENVEAQGGTTATITNWWMACDVSMPILTAVDCAMASFPATDIQMESFPAVDIERTF